LEGETVTRREKWLAWGIVGGLVLLIVGMCSAPGRETAPQSPTEPAGKLYSPEPPRPDLELVTWSWDGNYITGVVRNNTDRVFRYVQVEFVLFDSSGNQVGSTFTNVNNLQPRTNWHFRAYVFEKQATRAQFVRVSGW
jgi:hypothetical protein